MNEKKKTGCNITLPSQTEEPSCNITLPSEPDEGSCNATLPEQSEGESCNITLWDKERIAAAILLFKTVLSLPDEEILLPPEEEEAFTRRVWGVWEYNSCHVKRTARGMPKKKKATTP